jgi:NitT/TauT family transport system ATP-binding protein
MQEKLIVQNVCYSYHTPEGETPALQDISFLVHTGEFLAIVGPSGCGKSTLLSLLCGLLRPESGAITLCPENASGAASPHIGYMLQKDHLFEWRTILGNVSLGLEIQKKLDDTSRQELLDMLAAYGLKGFEMRAPVSCPAACVSAPR